MARRHVVVQARKWRALEALRLRVRPRSPDIAHMQLRKRRQRLGRIRLFLQTAQLGDILPHALLVLVAHRGELRCELGGLFGLATGLLRHHVHERLVAVLRQKRRQNVLEITPVQTGAHMRQRIFVAQIRGSHIIAVEPTGQRVHRQRYAVGHTTVTFAQVERHLRKRCLQQIARDALFGKASCF